MLKISTLIKKPKVTIALITPTTPRLIPLPEQESINELDNILSPVLELDT